VTTKRRFGLDRLLALTRQREDEAQRLAAEARRTADADATAHVTELEAYRRGQAAGPGPSLGADAFAREQQLAALRAQGIEHTRLQKERSEAEALEAYQVWLDAARQRKTMDRLDERDRSTRAILAARAAQRALDDLNAQKRRRGR
jgi:flagellar export protein FliJ